MGPRRRRSTAHTYAEQHDMEMETLRDLYVEELKDLYSAENQILKALPRMTKAATHPKLKKAFTKHERQTRQHAKRLERICKELGEKPTGKKCVGMEGLIQEAKDLLKEKPDKDVLDAGLISAAQHVEHYEMAGYGTCRTWARLLGYESQAQILQTTLDEEQQTDLDLTGIAESSDNLDAEE
jgi:ferritin-like metal-binding protein YciE